MPWEPLPSSAEKEPSPVGESLDRLVRHLGGTSAGAVGGLAGRWPEIVGERVAAHAQPVSIRDQVLLVTVDDPAWAPQLRFLEAQVLDRVREVLGVAGVTRLEVRVRRPS